MTRPDTASRRKALLRWYRKAKRDLPWRGTADPYSIWVSEVMLQQTRVETVIPYYHRFLDAFPNVAALAQADEDAVLAQWTGLGYYRRARSLHRGARQVMERFDGVLPDGPTELQSLPGIGRYTAGAIASIAFGKQQPILDGNVRRVFARLYALGKEGVTPGLDKQVWKLADEWVQGPNPGDLNQALMELGATVCTPTVPNCNDCPLAVDCLARGTGDPEAYPAVTSKPKPSRHDVAVTVIRRGNRILLEEPESDNPLRGRWELPALLLPDGPNPRVVIAEEIRRRHGLHVDVKAESGTAGHGIMNRQFRLRVFPGSMRRGRTVGNPKVQWVDLDCLSKTAISGATVKGIRIGTGLEIRSSASAARRRPDCRPGRRR